MGRTPAFDAHHSKACLLRHYLFYVLLPEAKIRSSRPNLTRNETSLKHLLVMCRLLEGKKKKMLSNEKFSFQLFD